MRQLHHPPALLDAGQEAALGRAGCTGSHQLLEAVADFSGRGNLWEGSKGQAVFSREAVLFSVVKKKVLLIGKGYPIVSGGSFIGS